MIDPALSAWLGLAADVAVLKEHGVDSLTLLSESPVAAPDGAGPVVFVARPTLRLCPPTEAGHTAIWAPSELALDLVGNDGDRAMLAKALRQVGPR